MKKANTSGFTLVEVMVVIAIVGILAVVAIPGYQSYVLKTYRVQAQSYVMNLANEQEAFYLRNNRFGTLVQLDNAGHLSDGVRPNDELLEGRFRITESASNNGFSYQLQARDVQLKDTDCLFIRVNQDTLIKGSSADDLCFET